MNGIRLPRVVLPQLGPGCLIPQNHPVAIIDRKLAQQQVSMPRPNGGDIAAIAARAAAQMPYRKIGR